MAVFGTNGIIVFISVVGALIYNGQVSIVMQKFNEVLHWKLGCNPIYSIGNVSLHYFSWRGKAEVIRLLLEDHKIPYSETRFTEVTWKLAQEIGIKSGLYDFGQVPVMKTDRGKHVSQRKVILHYLGRSVGLDCDCKELEKCDMIASAIEDVQRVFNNQEFRLEDREKYIYTQLLPWLQYLEKLAPNHDADTEGLYFSSGRLTWLDYLVFEMLESSCNLIEYKLGHQEIGVLNQLNCSEVLEQLPCLHGFYNYFKSRPNIRAYVSSDGRAKFRIPYEIT